MQHIWTVSMVEVKQLGYVTLVEYVCLLTHRHQQHWRCLANKQTNDM